MAPFLAMILAAAVLPPTGSESLDLRGLQGLSSVRRHVVDWPAKDQRYWILVREPEGYLVNPERRYPVVYLLDGGETFAALAGYTRYLRFGEEIPELIVVGISYGSADRQRGNARSRDYTAASAERDHWGGAGEFLDFLERRILPEVEATYRVDSGQRVLFGQSLGGQFVLYAARHAPATFRGLIASNPALHRNVQYFLGPLPARGDGGRPLLFVSSASGDEARFREPTLRWMSHWQDAASRPWVLETRDLQGHGHFSALAESFRQGLRWIFESGVTGDGKDSKRPTPQATVPSAEPPSVP